jgi:hypothetical protein
LLEVSTRKILCVCDPCGLRFENVVGRWKLIPRSARAWPGFRMSDAQWEALALPIDLVFIFFSSPNAKPVALYPSPAGAVESLLPLNDWERLTTANPALASMEPDVEALLINRVGSARQYFLAPIDLCYELSGLVRLHWRGLSGGPEIWRQIGAFFDRLNASAGAASSCPQQEEVAHA